MFHGEGRLCQVQMVHVAKREDVGSCHESVTHSPEDEAWRQEDGIGFILLKAWPSGHNLGVVQEAEYLNSNNCY